MKGLYVITKEGVFTQDVYAVYEDLDRAKEAARQIAKMDRDDYHSYVIVSIPLNHLPKLIPAGGWCGAITREAPEQALASYTRKDVI